MLHCTPDQIQSALATVYGVDNQLINDSAHFVAEGRQGGQVKSGNRPTTAPRDSWWVVAAGASAKLPMAETIGPGKEDFLLDPQKDAAKIHAFFVHSGWVRLGNGSLILEAYERAALALGFAAWRWEPQ